MSRRAYRDFEAGMQDKSWTIPQDFGLTPLKKVTLSLLSREVMIRPGLSVVLREKSQRSVSVRVVFDYHLDLGGNNDTLPFKWVGIGTAVRLPVGISKRRVCDEFKGSLYAGQ
jgi:hypothetical protein